MNKMLFAVIALLITPIALADNVGENPKVVGPESCNRPGRYILVQHPQVRADQFLVDTCLGRVWKEVTYTDLDNKEVWQLIPRTDNAAELLQWQMQELGTRQK